MSSYDVVLQRSEDHLDSWRVKSRLNSLALARPLSPPARTSQKLPLRVTRWGKGKKPAKAGFVADRREDVQARFEPPASQPICC